MYQNINWFQVDCSNANPLAARFGVESLPTVIIFNGLTPLERVVGNNIEGVKNALRQAGISPGPQTSGGGIRIVNGVIQRDGDPIPTSAGRSTAFPHGAGQRIQDRPPMRSTQAPTHGNDWNSSGNPRGTSNINNFMDGFADARNMLGGHLPSSVATLLNYMQNFDFQTGVQIPFTTIHLSGYIILALIIVGIVVRGFNADSVRQVFSFTISLMAGLAVLKKVKPEWFPVGKNDATHGSPQGTYRRRNIYQERDAPNQNDGEMGQESFHE